MTHFYLYNTIALFFHLHRLPEAERALVKAERCSERYSKMADSGGADVELDLVIVTGMGQ